MTPELTALALADFVQFAQLILFTVPANVELGTGYTTSPRDRPPSKPLATATARWWSLARS